MTTKIEAGDSWIYWTYKKEGVLPGMESSEGYEPVQHQANGTLIPDNYPYKTTFFKGTETVVSVKPNLGCTQVSVLGNDVVKVSSGVTMGLQQSKTDFTIYHPGTQVYEFSGSNAFLQLDQEGQPDYLKITNQVKVENEEESN